MFTFLLILTCVVIFCVIVSLVRIHVKLAFNSGGMKLNIKALFFYFSIYPLKKKNKKSKKENTEKTIHKGVELPKIKELLELGKETFGRLHRKLRVDLLKADVVVASEDPFKTAMMFGGSGAGVGVILATFENIFDIKKRDIQINADFSENTTRIALHMDISIRVGSAIAIGLFVLRKFIKLQKTADDAVKLEKNA